MHAMLSLFLNLSLSPFLSDFASAASLSLSFSVCVFVCVLTCVSWHCELTKYLVCLAVSTASAFASAPFAPLAAVVVLVILLLCCCRTPLYALHFNSCFLFSICAGCYSSRTTDSNSDSNSNSDGDGDGEGLQCQ